MLAMDMSDIYYDKFLINGANESQLSQFKAGDKVRLRISNGGASSYGLLTQEEKSRSLPMTEMM
jgi:cell envelope opacity-associated protein A